MTSFRHIDRDAAPSSDDAYLDAARASILAVGWSRATLTDVARRAGVSRMTLYRRWPDTGALLADLMTREWSRTSRTAAASLSPADAEDPLRRITSGAVATVQALRSEPLLLRIIEVDPEVLLPYLLERRGRSQEALAGTLSELVAAGQRAGAVRPGDPVLMARSLVLTCHGFTLSAHTMTDGADGAEEAGSPDRGVAALDAELRHLLESYLRP
jgi:AcrR family transcriptional regulator